MKSGFSPRQNCLAREKEHLMSDWLGELADRLTPALAGLYVVGWLVVGLAILVFAVRYLLSAF
jgi:hypothetical protein